VRSINLCWTIGGNQKYLARYRGSKPLWFSPRMSTGVPSISWEGALLQSFIFCRGPVLVTTRTASVWWTLFLVAVEQVELFSSVANLHCRQSDGTESTFSFPFTTIQRSDALKRSTDCIAGTPAIVASKKARTNHTSGSVRAFFACRARRAGVSRCSVNRNRSLLTITKPAARAWQILLQIGTVRVVPWV
jgi:hypothetical protein